MGNGTGRLEYSNSAVKGFCKSATVVVMGLKGSTAATIVVLIESPRWCHSGQFCGRADVIWRKIFHVECILPLALQASNLTVLVLAAVTRAGARGGVGV